MGWLRFRAAVMSQTQASVDLLVRITLSIWSLAWSATESSWVSFLVFFEGNRLCRSLSCKVLVQSNSSSLIRCGIVSSVMSAGVSCRNARPIPGH